VRITALDHLVLTVADLDATVAFYERLGMECRRFGDGRLALHFGRQKINLHRAGAEFQPHARQPEPGAADLCFLVDEPIAAVERALGEAGIEIEVGPVDRDGAQGSLRSVYVRDPDGNLIELSEPA
jgi:catechol 2,3-dioxygenase-like lactoylglutathione lyase family enzyme